MHLAPFAVLALHRISLFISQIDIKNGQKGYIQETASPKDVGYLKGTIHGHLQSFGGCRDQKIQQAQVQEIKAQSKKKKVGGT